MKLVPLNQLFEIEYGNQFDLNKMEEYPSGVNFISRSSQNLGVVTKVKEIDIIPYPDGKITVALGGSALSSFVQIEPFYTAQNIKVLTPKTDMDFNTKVLYCQYIEKNRFRYSTYGREANKSLDGILVPDLAEIPDWIQNYDYLSCLNYKSISKTKVKLSKRKCAWFQYDYLFDINKGRGARKSDVTNVGITPFITAIDSNNGLSGFVKAEPTHLGNVITVVRNGNGTGEAFYQEAPFCSTEDVHVFVPKFELNKYIALFLVTLIRKEKYRFSYGRKWGLARMRVSKIKLPINSKGKPDWKFMEGYIKSLPYSANL